MIFNHLYHSVFLYHLLLDDVHLTHLLLSILNLFHVYVYVYVLFLNNFLFLHNILCNLDFEIVLYFHLYFTSSYPSFCFLYRYQYKKQKIVYVHFVQVEIMCSIHLCAVKQLGISFTI